MNTSYQFVKYNRNTGSDYFLKMNQFQPIICIDFEDSISDPINPKNNLKLKIKARNNFTEIVTENADRLNQITWGFRVNSPDSEDFKLDFELLNKLNGCLNIQAIIIPKVESVKHIKTVEKIFDGKIRYKEIIPLIESKAGINNLENIIGTCFKNILKVGFGHCDYNQDQNIFPFFHQNSREYWKWVERIVEIINKTKIIFMNSAYLELQNDSGFIQNLHQLNKLTGGNFGQFTLSKRQTSIYNIFNKVQNSGSLKFKHRLDFNYSDSYAETLVKQFEENKSELGFVVENGSGILISPQEYISAKNKLKGNRKAKINIVYIGGCFPVQNGILFEDLFHYKLRNKIDFTNKFKMNLKIIRYENLIQCVEDVKSIDTLDKIDFIVFHIRPEPFLRKVKVLFRFRNKNGEIISHFNIPFNRKEISDHYNLEYSPSQIKSNSFLPESRMHKFMYDLNIIIGLLIGNATFSLKKYNKTILEIVKIAEKRKIKIILLGSPFRESSYTEKYAMNKFTKYFEKTYLEAYADYVSGFDAEIVRNNSKYFHKNGLATESYHDWVSIQIHKKITSIINEEL